MLLNHRTSLVRFVLPFHVTISVLMSVPVSLTVDTSVPDIVQDAPFNTRHPNRVTRTPMGRYLLSFRLYPSPFRVDTTPTLTPESSRVDLETSICWEGLTRLNSFLPVRKQKGIMRSGSNHYPTRDSLLQRTPISTKSDSLCRNSGIVGKLGRSSTPDSWNRIISLRPPRCVIGTFGGECDEYM